MKGVKEESEDDESTPIISGGAKRLTHRRATTNLVKPCANQNIVVR